MSEDWTLNSSTYAPVRESAARLAAAEREVVESKVATYRHQQVHGDSFACDRCRQLRRCEDAAVAALLEARGAAGGEGV